MRDYRMAVGNSLKGKIGELGFFLFRIIEINKTIEAKHIRHDYPLNQEMDALNYYFSAFLNALQSIKDACQTSMNIKVSWATISPTYGSFIFYCRNATTHDGSHMINAGQGVKNYILGPLQRIDNHGKLIKFDPPKEDIVSLCCNLLAEILGNKKLVIQKHGEKIPTPNEIDFKKSIESSLNSDFIPDYVKEMIKANKENIFSSFNGVNINICKQVCDAIEPIESSLLARDART
jgi:hypothetical protein